MPRDAPIMAPCNIEAEQALLGALLLDNDVLTALPSGFTGEMFFEPLHGRIFNIAVSTFAAGEIVSPVTLRWTFAADEAMAQLGGVGYLARMAGASCPPGVARDYAVLIRDLWVRREAIAVLDTARDRVSAEEPAHIAIEAAQGALSAIAGAASPTPLIHTQSAALADAMQHTQTGFANDGRPLTSTGLDCVDGMIGGLMPADHVVIMGESSMGKTALAICMAVAVMGQGKGVFFGSLEMQKGQIAHRMVSMELARRGHRIEYLDLIKGNLTEDEFRLALQAARDMEGGPLVYAEDNASSLPRLMTAGHAASKHFANTGTPLGLVVIDYLQLIRVPGTKSAEEEVGAAACGMKTLAKVLGVPVVSLCQMNRGDRDRKNRRPTKDRARGSGQIEESCDVMLGCYRDSYYLARDIQGCADETKRSEMIAKLHTVKNIIEFNAMKNRRGPLDTVYGWCDLPVNVILDTAPEHKDQGEFR